jgi:hypothetical protein
MATPAVDNPNPQPAPAPGSQVPFGVNEMRLTAWQWLVVLAIFVGGAVATPRVWPRVERFEIGADYRIPYALHKDYWLFQRRLQLIADPAAVPVLGDSVVWGEYVRSTGTLPHFLNGATGSKERFVNCGINGLFPLAMEGLLDDYGATLHDRRLIVHCNVLWMSSPKADLSLNKEEDFNHARLVPQFSPRIPCYRADTSERLGVVIGRNVSFLQWVDHLQNVYFDQRSIPQWTLAEDPNDPGVRPNAWRDPLEQITLRIPGEPADDPQRGPASARHRPWTAGGAKPTRFSWVALDESLQWQAFQRVIGLLRARHNQVLVILGPFNEHLVAERQRTTFRGLRDGIAAWLRQHEVPHVAPEALPSELYADASHPLTEGYARLAERIAADPAFRQWLAGR